jgi:hypothetical protein
MIDKDRSSRNILAGIGAAGAIGALAYTMSVTGIGGRENQVNGSTIVNCNPGSDDTHGSLVIEHPINPIKIGGGVNKLGQTVDALTVSVQNDQIDFRLPPGFSVGSETILFQDNSKHRGGLEILKNGGALYETPKIIYDIELINGDLEIGATCIKS